MKAEISRLEQSRKQNPISEKNFAELFSNVGDILRDARNVLEEGHVYLSLEKLGQAEDLLQGARRGVDRGPVQKGGFEAYQAEWGKVSVRLTALDKDAHGHEWGHSPLAIRALAEAAEGRAIPLLEGGLGFAIANGPRMGCFMLGSGGRG